MKKNDLEFYDRSADAWWESDSKIYALYHLNKPRFEFFDRHVLNWQNLKVLDVGCGGGFSCEFMAQRGAIVSGIDRSAKCIEKARDHAILRGFDIEYKSELAEDLPYNNSTFDVVVCVDVLEHIADLKKTVTEIHRVLKRGGIFLFDTINRNFKSKVIMIWLLENILQAIDRGIHDWEKFIKPEELTELMQANGFTDIEIKGFDMFGGYSRLDFSNYSQYKKTGTFKVKINDDTSVMYIGKAVKFT